MPKMHQNTFGSRLLSSPRPPSRNQGGPTSKGRDGRESEGEGWEGMGRKGKEGERKRKEEEERGREGREEREGREGKEYGPLTFSPRSASEHRLGFSSTASMSSHFTAENLQQQNVIFAGNPKLQDRSPLPAGRD